MTLLNVRGHSYATTPGTMCSVGAEYPLQVQSRLAGTLTNQSQNGLRLYEAVQAAWQNATSAGITSQPLSFGATGLRVIDCALNDIQNMSSPATAAERAGFKWALRSMLALSQAATVVAESASVSSGPWTTTVSTVNHGGSAVHTGTQGAYREWAGISSPTGYVWMSFLIVDPAALVFGAFDVEVDGITVVSLDLGHTANQMKAGGGVSGGAQTFQWAFVKVPLGDTSAHSVRFVKTDSAARDIWNNGLLIPMATPPFTVVCKDPINTANLAITTANKPLIDADIDAVLAEFTRVVSADLGGTGWSRTTMLGADGGHPNDTGMHFITDRIIDTIAKAMT